MNGKRFWQFRASKENPKVGELLLYGYISDSSWFEDDVTPKKFHDELVALGDIDELRIFINSGGGDVFAAQAIYNMCKRHKARKAVYIDGLAASAASLVAMAGDTIIMPRNAMMMIHNPWTFVVGPSDYLRKVADDMDRAREGMVAVYVAKTGLPEDKIIPMLDAETWMTAKEAVEKGFADELEEAKEVAASIRDGTVLVVNGQEVDLSRYRNRPKLAGAPEIKAGVVPDDISREKAPEDEPWEAPDLEDFTDKSWEDLTDAEKRRIAKHFAWAKEMPPEAYGNLKLPHHRPSDGKVVWRGVANAAARLDQADIPEEDKDKVRSHLGSHYKQFDKTPPWDEDDEDSKASTTVRKPAGGEDPGAVGIEPGVASQERQRELAKAGATYASLERRRRRALARTRLLALK